MSMRIMKWISLPVLLIGSLFSRFAGSFEFAVNLLVCVGAMVVVQRAISLREYLWAAGFVNLAIVFSPLTLLIKIFLILSFNCIVALAAVYAAWKTQTLAVLEVL
jgi:hypothetical protein